MFDVWNIRNKESGQVRWNSQWRSIRMEDGRMGRMQGGKWYGQYGNHYRATCQNTEKMVLPVYVGVSKFRQYLTFNIYASFFSRLDLLWLSMSCQLLLDDSDRLARRSQCPCRSLDSDKQTRKNWILPKSTSRRLYCGGLRNCLTLSRLN